MSSTDSDAARKPRGRPQLDITVVQDSNAANREQGGEDEESAAAALLKSKRIASSKRKTMPDKLHIDPTQLNTQPSAAAAAAHPAS